MAAAESRARPTPRIAWLLVPVGALVAFAPSLRAGFLADDFVMLHTIRSLDLPLQAFTHTDIGTTRGDPYRPLWLLATGAIGGASGSNAVAYHVVSILLYATTSIFVVVLARRFVELPVALVAGGVFALYPRHAEAVSWIGATPDVYATFLTLAAMVTLTVRRAPTWALATGVVAAVAAPLCKESGFAVPALAVLMVAALWPMEPTPVRRRRVVAVVVLSVGVAADLVVRTVVVHGLGNDVGEPFTLHRLGVVLASDVLGTLSTSQMPMLEHHVYLAVPLALAALSAIGAVATLRSSDGARKRLLVVGVVWYLLSLVPTYNNAISLNDSNGERLLYLPSVGVALAVAAVVAPLLKVRLGRLALALGALVALAACLGASAQYVTAATIRDRVVARTIHLAPKDATVVVLNIPDSYRSARLLGAGYADAVMQAGRPDLRVLTCAPNIVQTDEPQVLHFTEQPDGEILASSTSSLPFDTPESGRAISASGCTYRPGPGAELAPGLGTEVLLRLSPPAKDTLYLWFDGVDVRACAPPVCPALMVASPARRPR